MRSRRGFAITILMAALLVLMGLAAACGDDVAAKTASAPAAAAMRAGRNVA